MLNRKELLLLTAAEECAEVAQRITKAIRFGLDEVQEGQDKNNAERIIYEFNDLLAVLMLLKAEGLLPELVDQEAIDKKRQKVEKWLKYSDDLGILAK